VTTATVDDISLYIEAADQATLRRTLRAVLDHLDMLNQIAAASTAIGQSAKDHAHDRSAAAIQAATALGGSGPDSHALAASASEAYFSYLGFVCGAVHIGYCVKGVISRPHCGREVPAPGRVHMNQAGFPLAG
jgi:hypothetical protein